MDTNETIFGLTRNEIDQLRNSVLRWVDHNHPKTSEENGGSFSSAFENGSEMLSKDPTFVDLFRIDVQDRADL